MEVYPENRLYQMDPPEDGDVSWLLSSFATIVCLVFLLSIVRRCRAMPTR
jgi:hypothetical protein